MNAIVEKITTPPDVDLRLKLLKIQRTVRKLRAELKAERAHGLEMLRIMEETAMTLTPPEICECSPARSRFIQARDTQEVNRATRPYDPHPQDW